MCKSNNDREIFVIFIYNFVSILLNEKKLNQKSTQQEVTGKLNPLKSSAQAGHLSIRHVIKKVLGLERIKIKRKALSTSSENLKNRNFVKLFSSWQNKALLASLTENI